MPDKVYPINRGKAGDQPSGPPSEGPPRRLAAILAADIAGYSHLMGMDEEGTHARVKRHRRELIDPTIAEHYGKLIKNTGDGFVAMFDSPVEAVRCAIVIQQSMVGRNASPPLSQWIRYRIGVNLGDVIVESDDIYGEGVNIAARLEGLANPGDVYISGGIYEQIKHKLVCGYQSLGDRKVKNITDPVSVYRVLPDPTAVVQARHARWRSAIFALSITAIAIVGAVGWYLFTRQPMQLAIQVPTPVEPMRSAPQAEPTPTAPRPQAAPTPTAPPVALAPQPAPTPTAPPLALAPQAEPTPTTPPVVLVPQPAPTPTAPPVAPQPAPTYTAPPVALAPQPAPTPTAPPVTPKSTPTTVPAAPKVPSPSEAITSPAAPQVATTVPSPPLRPEPVVEPEMVSLTGGTFVMGSNEDPSEMPARHVTIKPFAISKFPITARQWKACVAAKACSYVATGEDDAPVTNLSWSDTQQYTSWLSQTTQKTYRLPSEAEWEFAARGGTGTRFWWGSQLRVGMDKCKGCNEPYDGAQPLKVGSLKPNPFGLYDMGGGADEWVADCWHKNYKGAPIDGSSWVGGDCSSHVLRGGSWKSSPSDVRPASRDHYDTGVRYPTHGFRIARSL